MKIIAFLNNKGGVGKTTCSRTMAEYLSKVKNRPTLAIDFDPQCNFSHQYLKMEIDPGAPEGLMPPIHPDYDPDDALDVEWDGRSSIAEIFYGQGVVPYPTYIEHLDLAPGHAEKLLAAEAVRRTDVVEKVHKQLSNFLNSPDVKSTYDTVVIDTAPSKGPLTVSVIKAATHIVIPSVMEEQPVQGIYGMLQLWMHESLAREKNRPLKLIGILPNMFKQTRLHKDILTSLQENTAIGKYIMPVKLSQRIVFAEIDSEDATPRSIFDLQHNHVARAEAAEVCEYIAERIYTHE
ncbi:MAG TPA: ParA family protein [Gammaproteobacteria bacterium]|jgi:chromosome partitioning protein|nr:ParA family protein [Gammaproteobacteria bacterium]